MAVKAQFMSLDYFSVLKQHVLATAGISRRKRGMAKTGRMACWA